MKYLPYLLTIAALTFSGIANQTSTDSCEDEVFLDECAADLGTFTFLKSYKLLNDKESGSTRYSYVLSRGTLYLFTVCNTTGGSNLIFELKDRSGKVVASSYNQRKREHRPKVGYKCPATGVYYLTYRFDTKQADCGVSILGFKRL